MSRNRSIMLWSCLHARSAKWPRARCENKMLRYLAGTSLADIFAKKFALLAANPVFANAYVEIPARPGGEDLLAGLLEDNGVEVRRPKAGHFSTLRESDAKYVLWVNPSLPFLRPGTVLEALCSFYRHGAKGLTATRQLRDWFHSPELGGWFTIPQAHAGASSSEKTYGQGIRKQEAMELGQAVHAFHIYDRAFRLRTGAYWKFSGDLDPMRFPIRDEVECLDVDTELDFQIVDALLEHKAPGAPRP